MKKLVAAALTTAMCLSTAICGQAAEEKSLTVGLALSGITTNAVFIDMTKNIQRKCDEDGYKLMTADIQSGTSAIVTALENFINGGCDVIILQNSAEESYADLLKNAVDKGIVIGSYDGVSDYAQYETYVSNEELGYQIGQECGKWVNEHEGSKKVAICGYSGLDFLVTREQGIEKGFKEACPDGEIVSVQDAAYPEEGVVVGENFLQACPDIQAVMGINDGGTLGVYEAFKASGKSLEKDGIGIFGCDASEDGLNAIKEGDMFICTMDLNLVNEISALYDRCVETALTGEVDESEKEVVCPINPIYLEDIKE